MMKRRRRESANGIRVSAALAPSLRQYELDQVQRVTALLEGGKATDHASRISAPCRDPPGEYANLGTDLDGASRAVWRRTRHAALVERLKTVKIFNDYNRALDSAAPANYL